MNTAYNSTTTVQDARTRYNALLAKALERIKARKTDETAQEPEEVTTTATDVTTTPTQQPEPVATPENVTTEPTEASKPEEVTATAPTKTTKTASPKPLGRDIYHIFYEKQSRWAIMFDKSVYHDPEGYALLSDNVVLIESKLDYKEEYSGKLIQEDGTESKKDMQLFSKYYKDICRPAGGKYAVTPKEIEERIKGEEFARKKRVICSILESDDVTDEEVKIHLKNNKDVRNYVNEQTKYQFVKLLFPAGESIYLYTKHLKRALKVAKILSTNSISDANNILQLTGEAGRIIVAGCITRPEDESSMTPLIIDLTDATLAPEATPATAPQPTEEDTAIAPEEVTTAPEATPETPVQEPEEVTTEEVATTAPEVVTTAEDDATVFRKAIEEYGNLGAKYLNTLDYTQATEQVYSTKRGNSTKVTERYYTIDGRTIYGLYRRYNRNGKRAEFVVYQDGQKIETRAYGKNNSCYKADIQYNGVKIVYNVTDGLVTRAELTRDDNTISVVFDDTNRPATPRDLPAPAPSKPTSKETAKEAPAMPVQEQPTSKVATAPTPEATTAPEEVQAVTTSKQEDDTTPYWLLLDNELRAQQEEQEQALATPEKSEEEPMHAPQMLKKIIEEKKRRAAEGTNTTPLKTAVGMTTEVLTKKRAKEFLGDDASDYNTYILVDGTYVVRFDRPELSTVLYIDDESKEYKEYQRRNISAVELWRNDAMRLHNPARDLDTIKLIPYCLKVLRSKNNVLEFSKYGDARYGYRRVTPDEVEIYKAAAREASEAFTKRLDSYIRRYGKKIYVHSYWANR